MGLLGIALVSGVIALVGHVTEYSKLRHAFDQLDAAWLPFALIGVLCAYAGYIAAYREVAGLEGGPKLRVWTVTRIVGLGFGAFVVGSAAGGLAVDYWALHRTGLSVHETLRRVLGLNTLQWAALGGLTTIAGVASLIGLGPGVPFAMALAWIVVVGFCFAAGAWVSAPRRIERFSRVEGTPPPHSWAPKLLVRWAWGWIHNALADAIGGLKYVRCVLGHPLANRAGFIGFPLYWLGQLLALYTAVRAFDQDIGPAALVLAYATGYVATALPLPVGGAGGVDAALAFALTLVGVPLAPALLAAVTYRGFSFWLPIIPAVALLPTAPHLKRDLEGLAA
ncbi:MAG TPA: lysylphosphatidylglycerol synthase transmembrane domain-containing protein [Conexibacter sp.]